MFIGRDGDGFWAYECNQKYTDTETLGDYGCGIHLQYYAYEAIARRYSGALYYIKHDYNVAPEYEDVAYHVKKCTHCVGYLRQAHDDVDATLVNRFLHDATFNCCPGNSARTAHTGSVKYTKYSLTQHKVTSTCCSGYVFEQHNFVQNASGRYICNGCGMDRDSDLGVLKLEERLKHNRMRPILGCLIVRF